MSKKIIQTGSSPNDGTGDTLRDSMTKVNDNFTEIYTGLAFLGLSNSATITANSTGFSNTNNVLFVSLANSKFPVNTEVTYTVPSGTTPISPLTGNTIYYVSFANSSALALSLTEGGANIDINDARTTNPGESHSLTSDVDSNIVFSTDSITLESVTVNTTSIFVGNSTVNTVTNSTQTKISNSTTNSTLTSTTLTIGNTIVNSTIVQLSSNLYVNSTSIYVSNGTSTNVNISGNTIAVGNSSVNNRATSNSIHISNTTANTQITLRQITLNNNTTVSAVYSGNSISIGNSSVNVFSNSSYLFVQSANVATNTGLTLGSSTSAANGYTFLPNGLKLNWGWVSANSSDGNATFTSAYTTNCWSVTATSNTSTATYQASVQSVNNTVAVIRTANVTSTNVFWMSIGF